MNPIYAFLNWSDAFVSAHYVELQLLGLIAMVLVFIAMAIGGWKNGKY